MKTTKKQTKQGKINLIKKSDKEPYVLYQGVVIPLSWVKKDKITGENQ